MKACNVLALLLVGCSTVLVSCSSSKHDPGEKYYLVAANTKLSYWQTAGAGLVKAAKEMSVAAEMVGPDTFDVQAQHDAFQRAIAAKPAGILVTVSDAKVLQPDIDQAVQQGIPVLTIDSDAPESKRLLFIGTNNHQAGLIGGRLAVKLTGGKGSVAVYTNVGQPNLEERLRGYKDAFTDSPGLKIEHVIDIKGNGTVAFDKTMELIKGGKSAVDAFVCLEAVSCKEVSEVLSREKVTGKIVIAMDTDKDTLDWISKGMIAATIGQKPYTMAYFGTKLLDGFHHKTLDQGGAGTNFATLPVFVDTGTTLIDKSNVDEFVKAQGSATTSQ